MLRPSPDLPLPREVHLHQGSESEYNNLRAQRSKCPGAAFEQLNLKRGRKKDQPFFDPVVTIDLPVALETIKKAQKADADEDVLFVFAHDPDIAGVVDFFPETANKWKKKGWAERVRWKFLSDLVPALEAVGADGGKVCKVVK